MVTKKTLCIEERKNEKGNTVRVFDSPFYTVTTEETKKTILMVSVKAKKKYYPSVCYTHLFGVGWQQEVRFPIVKKLSHDDYGKWLHICHQCEINIKQITELLNNIQDMKEAGGIYYVN